MKKYLLLLVLFTAFHSYSGTIHLKQKVFLSTKEVMLYDLIEEDSASNIKNFSVMKVDKLPKIIKSSDVLRQLFNNGFYDLALIGEEVIVYPEEVVSKKESNVYQVLDRKRPVEFLEEYLESFLDKNVFDINITLLDVEPFVNMDAIDTDFTWKLDKLKSGLEDFEKIKRIELFVGDKRYLTTLDIDIYADVWISRKNFLKGDFIQLNGFYKKRLDITSFKKIGTLVFDIDNAANSSFLRSIGTGEALRWTSLKKIPLVKRGEDLKLVLERDGIEVSLQCTAASDGLENEKIRVKLLNGKEKFGVLCRENGINYVKIL